MRKLSTLRLAGRLRERVQVFIRQEIQLANREMAEKLASYRSGLI